MREREGERGSERERGREREGERESRVSPSTEQEEHFAAERTRPHRPVL